MNGQPSDNTTLNEYKPRLRTFSQMREEFPERRPESIHGLLRQGEILLANANSKEKKSWLFLALAMSVSFGRLFLDRFQTKQGKVLLLDMELHEEELTSRADLVSRAMFHERLDCEDLFLESLRGRVPSLQGLGKIIEQAGSEFDLILVDCLYRIRGFNESDPEKVKDAFNMFDSFARSAGASIGLVHHNSKGEQSHKSITDLGSGSGVLTRSPDTLLAIRPHQQDGYSVLDFKRRSGIDPESITAQFEFPLWRVEDDLEPVLKAPTRRSDVAQKKRDAEGESKILDSLKRGNDSKNAVRTDTGMGHDRANRLFRKLLDEQKIRITGSKEHRNGSEYDVYQIA